MPHLTILVSLILTEQFKLSVTLSKFRERQGKNYLKASTYRQCIYKGLVY